MEDYYEGLRRPDLPEDERKRLMHEMRAAAQEELECDGVWCKIDV